MSKNLNKCIDKLRLITSIKNKNLRNKMILAMMDDCLLKAIKEIILNADKNFKNLTPRNQSALRKHRATMLSVLRSKLTKANKKRIGSQLGGFWTALIPIGLQILGSLIGQ